MPYSALADYSDWSYVSALVLYVAAMAMHAGQLAMNRSVASPATGVLVHAGSTMTAERDRAGDGPGEHPTEHGDEHAAPSRVVGPAARLGRMAVAITVLGGLAHVASLVLRGLATERMPLGNMYEFTSALCLVAVATWLVVLRREAAQKAGVFVLLPIVVLLFLAGTVLYTAADSLQPALQSYWLVIHVSTVSVASGVLLVAGVASVLYLVRGAGDPARGRLARLRLPTATVLDRLAYRATVFAFPVYTFALITGAIWAEAAWGRYWGWDPKETVAFVAWVVYACYLHARATAGWRRIPAAWINVLGLATMVFNLFFINLVVAGLHSYAGVG